jgi:hypothetical protein
LGELKHSFGRLVGRFSLDFLSAARVIGFCFKNSLGAS